MKRTNDLGRDSIWSLVLRLCIPTMLAQLVSVLYSIVDRMYIGAGVGDLALAGVGCVRPYRHPAVLLRHAGGTGPARPSWLCAWARESGTRPSAS